MKTNDRTMKKIRERYNEISATRTGGFGGSDAEMIYMIAVKGLSAIKTTYKKRIRVAKGIDDHKPMPATPAMQKGHEFEDWYEKQSFAPIAEREALIHNNSFARNFLTFAHADFAADGEVWELKCVQDPDSAEDDYFEQLQWYYMLGMKAVWLVVCDSKAESFESGCRMPVLVPRDENVIEILKEGISVLDSFWDDLDLDLPDNLTMGELSPQPHNAAIMLKSCLLQIKEFERQAEEAREVLKQYMEEFNIQNIKSDDYTITYVPESTTRTLDKSKLFKAHPEINEEDFVKISPKKSYLKITLK